jgi:hypothetical protein
MKITDQRNVNLHFVEVVRELPEPPQPPQDY